MSELIEQTPEQRRERATARVAACAHPPRRTVGRKVHLYQNLHTEWLRRVHDDYVGTATVTGLRTSYLTDHKVVLLDNGAEYSLLTGAQIKKGPTRFVFAD